MLQPEPLLGGPVPPPRAPGPDRRPALRRRRRALRERRGLRRRARRRLRAAHARRSGARCSPRRGRLGADAERARDAGRSAGAGERLPRARSTSPTARAFTLVREPGAVRRVAARSCARRPRSASTPRRCCSSSGSPGTSSRPTSARARSRDGRARPARHPRPVDGTAGDARDARSPARAPPRRPGSTTSGSPTTSRSRPTTPRARAAATWMRSRRSRTSRGRRSASASAPPCSCCRTGRRSRPRSGSRRSRSSRAGVCSLGVGAGWMEAEFRALGVPRAQRGRITDATLAFLHAASRATRWSATASRFLFLPRPARPPIFVGGAPPHALARVLRYGDGWMPMVADPAKLARCRSRELRELAAARAGPRPRSSR